MTEETKKVFEIMWLFLRELPFTATHQGGDSNVRVQVLLQDGGNTTFRLEPSPRTFETLDSGLFNFLYKKL